MENFEIDLNEEKDIDETIDLILSLYDSKKEKQLKTIKKKKTKKSIRDGFLFLTSVVILFSNVHLQNLITFNFKTPSDVAVAIVSSIATLIALLALYKWKDSDNNTYII